MCFGQVRINCKCFRDFDLSFFQAVLQFQCDAEIVMRDRGGWLVFDHFAKQGGGLVQVGLLEVSETHVEARHIVSGIEREDFSEDGDACVGFSAIHQDETKVVVGVEVLRVKIRGATVGRESSRFIVGVLAGES